MHHETETYSQYFFSYIFWFPLQCNIFTPNKPKKNKVSTKKTTLHWQQKWLKQTQTIIAKKMEKGNIKEIKTDCKITYKI